MFPSIVMKLFVSMAPGIPIHFLISEQMLIKTKFKTDFKHIPVPGNMN